MHLKGKHVKCTITINKSQRLKLTFDLLDKVVYIGFPLMIFSETTKNEKLYIYFRSRDQDGRYIKDIRVLYIPKFELSFLRMRTKCAKTRSLSLVS